MKRASNLIYVIPGILIAVFVVYFTISYKSPKSNLDQKTKAGIEHQGNGFASMDLLISDTWWNDEQQLAIDFYEDATGLYVEGVRTGEEVSYQVGLDSVLVIQNKLGDELFRAKINEVDENTLRLNTSRLGSLVFEH